MAIPHQMQMINCDSLRSWVPQKMIPFPGEIQGIGGGGGTMKYPSYDGMRSIAQLLHVAYPGEPSLIGLLYWLKRALFFHRASQLIPKSSSAIIGPIMWRPLNWTISLHCVYCCNVNTPSIGAHRSIGG